MFRSVWLPGLWSVRLATAASRFGLVHPVIATRAAFKVERIVCTRYPPSKARELTSFLGKTLSVLEQDTEAFELDKTAGVVDSRGFLVEAARGVKERVPGAYEAGVHTGSKHPESSGASTKKEAESTEGEGKKAESSRRRRHRREEKKRSKSRSRRREKKSGRGTKSPEVAKEEVVATASEPEAAEELCEEPEEDHEDGSQDDEVEQRPQGYGLRQAAKPSSRKPLPRRPRTPSVSPPGFRSGEPTTAKRWKGWAHVVRGQERFNKGKGKGKGGKGRPFKGQTWPRR